MTVQQVSQYLCDRCQARDSVPLEGSGPLTHRMVGPTNWTMLRIGPDPATPPSHLCPRCSTEFANFMVTKVS